MSADGLLCFQVHRLARWTAVVVDRDSGLDCPMPAVRFRWRSSVDTWIEQATAEWLARGEAVSFAARKLT